MSAHGFEMTILNLGTVFLGEVKLDEDIVLIVDIDQEHLPWSRREGWSEDNTEQVDCEQMASILQTEYCARLFCDREQRIKQSALSNLCLYWDS